MRLFRSFSLLCSIGLSTLLLQACAISPPDTQDVSANHDTVSLAQDTDYHVVIRRTALGIPHIKADNWSSLGYGYGYAQAQDNLCTLADGFVTWRGERSRYFGASARPDTSATFGQPSNLDADFFFRFVDDAHAVRQYRDSQTPTMRALVDGFAAGYNRYVSEIHGGAAPGQHLACRSAPWVGAVTSDDIYRRLYAANLAGGEARFVAAIANAQPPAGEMAAPVKNSASLAPQPAHLSGANDATEEASAQASFVHFGGHAGIGSNGLAFGADATHRNSALLFGNPHWFWKGPDRFYQAQLTIPGEVDVSGVSFLGVPVIVIGFNQNVAWTHTVSTAARFGLFQLSLVPGSPTSYRYDGRVEAMTPTIITVPVRQADGTLLNVSRTLYRSRFGPVVNLGAISPALAWNTQQTFAIRDINADNYRVFENFLDWNRARSLDDFIRIQKKNAAVPWVNTLAIGRNDPRVWFADIGAMPNVPDALALRCTTPTGKAFAQRIPGVPVLDGSSSQCNWLNNPGAPQAGALPVADMPSLLRRDYVGNFNGSYWLTQPKTPLTGYAKVTGIGVAPQTLRTRLGHRLAGDLETSPSGVSAGQLEAAALNSEAMSATLFKQPILAKLCTDDSLAAQGNPIADAQIDDMRQACRVLSAWNDTGNSDARGATLWDTFWRLLDKTPAAQLYATQFDPSRPLETPGGIALDREKIAATMRTAMLAMRDAGLAIDAPRSDAVYTERNGKRIAIFGGCDDIGYFTAACALHPLNAADKQAMDGNPNGNSYLQTVYFSGAEVVADTLLAHAESDDPASPHYADATLAYSQKQWLHIPFTEKDISNDPALTIHTLNGIR